MPKHEQKMTLAEARKLLPPNDPITDKQLMVLLAEDYAIANLVIDEVLNGRYPRKQKEVVT
jgi:hypothetical protein